MAVDADKALMAAVLSQVEVANFKIDYEKLAQELSLSTKSAAYMRWSRFKAKLNVSGSAPTTSPLKPRTPKAKTNGKNNGSPSKKRKMNISDWGDEDEDLDLERGVGDEGKGFVEESQNKKLPVRKGRSSTFKVEDGGEDEIDDEVIKYGGKEMEVPLNLDNHSEED